MNKIISKVNLNNFRCHELYGLNCDKKTTLILGENGCGKTSVLEAIYIAFQGKSFRATDKDIVKRETDFYKIEILLNDGEKNIVTYDGNKKTFLVKDEKKYRLPKDKKYPIVLFLPNDLSLVDASPSRKRDYFDRILSQVYDGYSSILSKYNKALKQRNELLKQGYATTDSLFSWDVLLSKYGVEIRTRRTWLINEINKKITETYQSIAKNKDEVKVEYLSYTAEVSESEYLKLLIMDLDRDKILGHTSFGVHRDDYEFQFNNSLAEGSASRGETRSIVLALKFIEAKILENKLNKKPIVLLDDVFSELDKTRRTSLVDNFKENQVILTSVEKIS